MMGFSDLITFLTIIPAGGHSIRGAASHMHYMPAVGLVIGVPAGLFGWLVSIYAGPLAGAAVALAGACILAGFHHMDGLADFADGMMAGGSHERRLGIMQDNTTGAGGVTAVVFCIMITVAAASQRTGMDILVLVVAAEVAAKYSMVVAASVGKAAAQGSGLLFCEAAQSRRLVVATCMWLIPGVLCMWFMPEYDVGHLVILACISAALISVILTAIASRTFGGITGDVMGAAHEVGRAIAVLCMVSWWGA